MKILVSGASGFVGSALVPRLRAVGHQVTKLVRDEKNLKEDEIFWQPNKAIVNSEELEGFDVVIHLSGENIMDRWTEEKKRKIIDSRVIGTRFLAQVLAELKNPPKLLISASAIGFYGDRGDEELTEKSGYGDGFLAEVCLEWEEATNRAGQRGIRVANLRFGVILSPDGGALKKMLFPFKMGLGGKIGDGEQYMSWIAIDDVMNIIEYIIKNGEIDGPINVVSPNPVTNYDFTKTLGKVLYRPTFFSIPAGVAEKLFGEMAEEMLLSSTRVIPKKLLDSGYTFQYPELEGALIHLLEK